MKILTLGYSEVFPKEPYGINKRYEYTAQVDDGEDDIAVRKLLVKKVRDWHLENGGLILNQHHESFEGVADQVKHLPIVPTELPVKNLADEKIEIAIDNATTKEQLSKLMPTLPIHLKDMYEKKLNELTA